MKTNLELIHAATGVALAKKVLAVLMAAMLVGGVVCGAEQPAAPPKQQQASEPSPPDVLDIVMAPAAENAAGTVAFDAVVKPSVDSEAELEIDDPGGARLKTGLKAKRFTLRHGGEESRERVQLNVVDGKPRTVKVRLRLLGADGKPWLILDREVKVNQPQDEAQRRVPVVQVLPDGSRVVEYISSKEAAARGLPPEGRPAPAAQAK